ncbi:MAG: hypothetical protein KatS3mg054_0086 [Chloroflexus sp.]|nr:MAG: hypothetical protein KatS3mg054_0086 [Chloroflexus sp.]
MKKAILVLMIASLGSKSSMAQYAPPSLDSSIEGYSPSLIVQDPGGGSVAVLDGYIARVDSNGRIISWSKTDCPKSLASMSGGVITCDGVVVWEMSPTPTPNN